MSLREYRRKRNFQATPEPAGGAQDPGSDAWSYVVQKHAASRLHYDFRLHLDGVLKSWAVPKGPSLDPKEKRLAVMYRVATAARAALRGLRTRNAPFPRMLEPQLATLVDAAPSGSEWLHEMKFDGYRILARLDRGRVQLWSRSGHDWTRRFPAISRAVASLPARRAWLDGEAAVVLADGSTSSGALQNANDLPPGAGLAYFAFDLLHLDDADLRRVPLEERKRRLKELLPEGDDTLRFSDHVVGDGPRFLSTACRMSLEGAVSKRRDGPYRPGRSTDWVKAKCLREDKEAKDVKRERPVAIEVAGVRLTHPERVLFAEAGVTKEGLARYYERMADAILPHLEDRPLTLVRCPGGSGSECFFVKHPGPWAPRSLRRVAIQEKTKRADYLIVDTREGLISLAQMGVLEIHTWNARARDLERPDRIVFDLDPGPGVAWAQVAAAAVRIRECLERLDLVSVVKSSGGKGVHVVVPTAPRASWDEAHELSRLVSESLERDDPALFVTEMAKAKRQGRILIDYARNHRGSTSVAAWSTRAKPHAPVSVPIEWDELAGLGRGDALGMDDAIARVQGADPWAGAGALRQSITAARLKKAHAL